MNPGLHISLLFIATRPAAQVDDIRPSPATDAWPVTIRYCAVFAYLCLPKWCIQNFATAVSSWAVRNLIPGGTEHSPPPLVALYTTVMSASGLLMMTDVPP